MSGNWPFPNGSFWTELGADTSITDPSVADAGASHTKGDWAQLGASTLAYTAKWAMVRVDGHIAHTAGVNYLLDIGVGTSGNEVVLFPNLLGGSNGNRQTAYLYLFPCMLPAGTQINHRCQNQNGSAQGCAVHVMFGHTPMFTESYGNLVTVYGASTSSTNATSVSASSDPGKGAWAELTASSTYNTRAMILAIHSDDTSTTDGHNLLDIGVGSAGNEVVVIPDWHFGFGETSDIYRNSTSVVPIPCQIPAGSRISARVHESFQATGGSTNLAIYCIS